VLRSPDQLLCYRTSPSKVVSLLHHLFFERLAAKCCYIDSWLENVCMGLRASQRAIKLYNLDLKPD